MEQNPQIWQTWAETLAHWGVKDLAATFIEVLGPFNIFGAQLLYVGQPFLNSILPEGHLDALTDLLESPQETQAFVSVLRQPDVTLGS